MALNKHTKWIVGLALFGLAGYPVMDHYTGVARAEQIELDTLPKEKADQIRQTIESTKPKPEDKLAAAQLATVNKYTTLGTAVGSALKATAVEIGIDPKEFSNSTLGYATYAWLAWELVLGQVSVTASNVAIGGIWMIFFFAFWNYMFKRICLVESTTYEDFERPYVDDKGNEKIEKGKRKVVQMHDIQDGVIAGYRLAMLVVLIIGSIPGWIFLS